MEKSYVRDDKLYLYGFFVRNLWRDERTGASVFFMDITEEPVYSKLAEKKGDRYRIRCMGRGIPPYEKGTPVLLAGAFKEVKDGYEFQISSALEAGDAESFTEYAAKRYVLTQSVAKALVEKTGGNLSKWRPEIEQIVGVSRRKAALMSENLMSVSKEKRQRDELLALNVPYTAVMRAVKKYGDKAYESFADDPWRTGLICGCSFLQCDAIAEKLGISFDTPLRMEGLFKKIADDIAGSGNTWCDKDVFFSLCEKAGLKDPEYDTSKVIKPDGERIAFTALKEAEERIAKNINRLQGGAKKNFSSKTMPDMGITYSPAQKEAFKLLTTSGIKILTGGPGTGKTTVTKGLVRFFIANKKKAVVKLAAPTGRAAQRLSESVGLPASTVHQLLEYRPEEGDIAPNKTEDNPIEADLLVIDEMSMMNIEMFDLLTSAVKTGTTVLLAGDPDQLPPIGPGNILSDLITPGVCEHVHLKEVFRQGAESLIVTNAVKIAQSDFVLKTGDDFKISRVFDSEDALKTIKQIVPDLHDPDDPFSVQVLSPVKKGLAGVDNLNKELSHILNPDRHGAHIQYGYTSFYREDKVITTVNNYDAGYFNGDTGTVKEVTDKGLVLSMRGKEFVIERDCLCEVSLAYAMTIHKSQGSEFDTVIISMPTDMPKMLVKNLLYTAVTRARKRVIIVTVEDALERAIGTDSIRRKTYLAEMLKEEA